MALEGSVLVKGATQGAFKGLNPVKDRAGTSVVTEFESMNTAPRDAATGMATGKRQWGPYRWRQPADAATINYQQALVTNEVLSSVVFNFYRPLSNQLTSAGAGATSGGEKKPYFTIEVTNGQVQSVRFVQLDTRSEHPDIKNREIFIEVLITFMKTTWTWTDGGVTFTDEWQTSV